MVTKLVICYHTGIIVAAKFMIIGSVFCHCDWTSVLWVLDHMSWLGVFLSGFILYAINNCATSWFCLGLTLLFVTEAFVLVVFLFLLCRSFNACSIAVLFNIRCWVLQLIRYHYYFLYQRVVSLMSTPFWILFSFTLPRLPQPPQTPLSRPPIPQNWLYMTPLPLLLDKLTWRPHPHLPGDVWVSGKRLVMTVDRYVEAVSKWAPPFSNSCLLYWCYPGVFWPCPSRIGEHYNSQAH